MHTTNPIQQRKLKRFNCFSFLYSLFVFMIILGGCSSAEEDKQAKSGQALSSLTKTTVPIEGMSCNACVASIKKELKSLDASEHVEVSLEHRNATVFYEEGTLSALQIQQAINAIGYKAGEPVTEKGKQ